MEAVEMRPSLDEHVLHHVIGIFVGQHDTTHLPIQLFAVFAHHPFESPTLRSGIGELLHQELFVVLTHCM